jgi:putative tricarboxylic transport membrane protein
MSDESKEAAKVSGEESVQQTGQKRINIIASLVLIALGVYIIITAMGMKIMDQYAPSSGLFPLMVGILISLLALSMFIENINPRKPDSASAFKNRHGVMSSGLLMVGLIVFCVVLVPLGYVLDTFAFVIFVMVAVERSNWKTSIITAVCITLLLFLIFQVGLKTTLPQGILGF